MPDQLTTTYPRLWSLDAGVAMVVTDLHGDWEAYVRYRDRFVDLHARGAADWLILTGDLIHREPGDGPDQSLNIVLDVLALRERYGAAIIALCGNHELPHLYGLVLGKGATEYTPAFEAALSRSGSRAAVRDLFDALPFYVRTAAGVSVTHAGAFTTGIGAATALFAWNHHDLRAWVDARLSGADIAELRSGYARLSGAASYNALARHCLTVTGEDDPRYDDLLRGFLATAHPDFRLLRAALFTRCEQEYGEADYAAYLTALLEQLSAGYAPQRVLVAGHMQVRGGHTVVAGRHLRLASAAHATPREAGQYLVFDTTRAIEGVVDLKTSLQCVY